jgi:hypothetical protein
MKKNIPPVVRKLAELDRKLDVMDRKLDELPRAGAWPNQKIPSSAATTADGLIRKLAEKLDVMDRKLDALW